MCQRTVKTKKKATASATESFTDSECDDCHDDDDDDDVSDKFGMMMPAIAQQEISSTEVYCMLIREKQSFVPCDSRLRIFCFRDFDEQNLCLKNNKYIFIHRTGKYINKEEWNWICWCSCQPNTGELAQSLHVNMKCGPNNESLSEYFPQCIHLIMSQNIISELDDYFGILPNIDYVGKS
jgi:hypothetical protein